MNKSKCVAINLQSLGYEKNQQQKKKKQNTGSNESYYFYAEFTSRPTEICYAMSLWFVISSLAEQSI